MNDLIERATALRNDRRHRRPTPLTNRVASRDPTPPPHHLTEDLLDMLHKAEDAFVSGDLHLAARAYTILLPELSWHPRTDAPIQHHVARWVRALYETRPPVQRGQAVLLALQALSAHAPVRPLEAMRQARDPSPAVAPWQQFTTRLRVALLQNPTGNADWRSLREALLAELPPLDDAIQKLIWRIEHIPNTPFYLHQQLINALVKAGRAPEALAAIADAQRVMKPSSLYTRLFDRKARIAEQAGLLAQAFEARRLAFRAAPTLGRAAWLILAAHAQDDDLLGQVLEEAWCADPPLPQQLVTLFEIAEGHTDIALARLQESDTGSWVEPEHPGVLVLPLLIRLGLGRRLVPASGSLTTLWHNQRVWLPQSYWGHGHWAAPPEGNPPKLHIHADVIEPLLHLPSDAESRWWRARAAEELARLSDFAAETKDYYPLVGHYAACLGEAALLAGDRGEVRRLLDTLIARHPRHRALNNECKKAMAASPIITRG